MEQYGVRGGAGRRKFGRAGLLAVVTAGCVVAALAAGPSWALQQPGPRPAAGTGAPGAPGASTLPAVATKLSRSDLEVVRLDPDPAPPGGTTTVHAFVANQGPDTTASPLTITVTLPKGVTAEGPLFPEDCQVLASGRKVRCVFAPGLRAGRDATALVPVRLSPDLPLGTLRGGWVEVRSADDSDRSNNRQLFEIEVVETSGG